MRCRRSSKSMTPLTSTDLGSASLKDPALSLDFFGSCSGVITFFTLCLLCVVPFLLAPPLQTPDENAHLIRAYLLGHGYIVLGNQPGRSSGGFVNTGLTEYVDLFSALPFHPERKLTRNDVRRARQIHWSNSAQFSETPSTAVYFPLFYVPQAIGLRLGEAAGWTVDSSYTLARLLAASTCALLVAAGFYWHAPSWAVSGVLLLPMSTFLMASLHPEGLSNAGLIALLGFICGRIRRDTETTPRTIAAVSAASAFLAVYRAQLAVPLILAPLLLPRGVGKVHRWIGAGAAAMFVLSWLGLTLSLVVDIRTHDYVANSVTNNAVFLLTHPLAFISLFFNTVTSGGWLRRTVGSFIGYLGWCDAPLAPEAYASLLICLLSLVWTQLAIGNSWKSLPWWRMALMLGGGLAALAVFPILALAVGDLADKSDIKGIQGRYFIAPVLVMLYGMTDSLSTTGKHLWRLMWTSWTALVFTSIAGTTAALTTRYYLG